MVFSFFLPSPNRLFGFAAPIVAPSARAHIGWKTRVELHKKGRFQSGPLWVKRPDSTSPIDLRLVKRMSIQNARSLCPSTMTGHTRRKRSTGCQRSITTRFRSNGCRFAPELCPQEDLWPYTHSSLAASPATGALLARPWAWLAPPGSTLQHSSSRDLSERQHATSSLSYRCAALRHLTDAGPDLGHYFCPPQDSSSRRCPGPGNCRTIVGRARWREGMASEQQSPARLPGRVSLCARR
jgi:hypothetical protein